MRPALLAPRSRSWSLGSWTRARSPRTSRPAGRRSRIFLLLAAAVAVLGFSLVKQLRKAQAAEDAGVYDDEPADRPDDARRAGRRSRAPPDPGVQARRAQPRRTSRTRQSQAVRGRARRRARSSTVRATRSARITSKCSPAEVGEHVLGRHQHGRVLRPAGALDQVGRVVGHQQEGAARRAAPRTRRAPPRRRSLGRQLQVGDQHQVVGAPGRARSSRRRRPSAPGCRRPAAALVQADLREVDGGDLPAPAGQPDRVAALAGREVDRPARGRSASSSATNWFGRRRPDELGVGVAAVPGVGVHVDTVTAGSAARVLVGELPVRAARVVVRRLGCPARSASSWAQTARP